MPLVAVDGRRVVAVHDRDGDDAGDVRLCVAFAWLAGGRATVNLDVCSRLGSAVATLHERMASIRLGGKDDDGAASGGAGIGSAVGPTAAVLPVLDSVWISPPLAVRVRDGDDDSCGSSIIGDGKTTPPVDTFDDDSADDGTVTRGLIVSARQAALIGRATECCARLLQSLHAGNLGGTRQICHGDIHPANVMQDDAGGLHLIDFDGCANGFAAQDLAVLLWALRFDGLEEILTGLESPQYASRRAAVLRGYTAVRPLPEECAAQPPSGTCAVYSSSSSSSSSSETAAGSSEGSGGDSICCWPALPLLDALVAHRDLVVLAWFAATPVTFLRPRVGELADATLGRMSKWASAAAMAEEEPQNHKN